METNCAERVLELSSQAQGASLELDSRLELESLDFLELIKDVETEFSVRISDNEIIHINTPQDLIDAVEAQLSVRLG